MIDREATGNAGDAFHQVLQRLSRRNDATILLIVIDGLGGFADTGHGTELEQAATPNLDALARDGILGLLQPAGPGITPGSGPGHLALFGYDPLTHQLGRGALTAAGIDVELGPGDVAARGNVCTLDDDGVIRDRRAGRIGDEEGRRIAGLLRQAFDQEHRQDVEIHHVKRHRVLLVLRGDDLDPRVADTDPQITGVPPRAPEPLVPEAKPTADAVAWVCDVARKTLAGEVANGVLWRGFEGRVELPAFGDRYGLRPAAVASYPMYRGIARLLGMDVGRVPTSLDDGCAALQEMWDEHDFLFFHYKPADRAGEDGDRAAKVKAIEDLDALLPRLLERAPDVVAVTGDHATPSQLAEHSWHPVPTLIRNGRECDEQTRYGERWCRQGALGYRPSTDLMPLLLAMAGKLSKFGA